MRHRGPGGEARGHRRRQRHRGPHRAVPGQPPATSSSRWPRAPATVARTRPRRSAGATFRPRGLPREAIDRWAEKLAASSRRRPKRASAATAASRRAAGPEDDPGTCARRPRWRTSPASRGASALALFDAPSRARYDRRRCEWSTRSSCSRGRSWRPAPRRPGSAPASIPSRAWCRAGSGARRAAALDGDEPAAPPAVDLRVRAEAVPLLARADAAATQPAVWGALLDPGAG